MGRRRIGGEDRTVAKVTAGRTAVDQVRDHLYGVPDEVRRFALAHAAYADTGAKMFVDDLLDEVEGDLVDACEGVHPKKNDGLERRAALVRLAARARSCSRWTR